ncbi:putative carboxypeptidase D [Helianthus annuus]|nr:putative carboxypeptidase D [Helianthus annuus]
MGGGAFTELGPFFPLGNGRGLRRNSKSWNKASNLLFVESPAGVGWSYSNTTSDYTTGDANTGKHHIYHLPFTIYHFTLIILTHMSNNSFISCSIARDMHTFLINWYKKFPSFKSRDLYLTGESYAGMYLEKNI